MKQFLTLVFFLFLFELVISQVIRNEKIIKTSSKVENLEIVDEDTTALLYLIKTSGSLDVIGVSSMPSYEIYFPVPIVYNDQSPIWLEVECPQMIDYKFMRLDSKNTLVSAHIENVTDSICINWTSWVMTRKNKYKDYPMMEPMPDITELPDSVLPWLTQTSTIPFNNSYIKNIADSIGNTTNQLYSFARRAGMYSAGIPYSFPVQPESHGAYYAMKWGASCTGKAHAAAAILRANGVPARILMNLSSFYPGYFDFHWILEYYIPKYGWVQMEPSIGEVPFTAANREIICFACDPEDEFPLLLTNNLESPWFSSDTLFGLYPNWSLAHKAIKYWWEPENKLLTDTLLSVCQENYNLFTKIQGANITTLQTADFEVANSYQFKAYEKIKSGTTDSMVYYLNQANNYYKKIVLNKTQTIFFDDFENGINGWTTGGTNDEWQLGTPTNYGPSYTYSGSNCWGVNIDSFYKNNANCWLESPSINLFDLATAYVEVKIWNDVQDDSINGTLHVDKLWLEISTENGNKYSPISLQLGGVCDLNTGVPKVAGWSRLKLDLTPYVDNNVKIRFHFTSNESISRPGSYIDNFLITGRQRGYDFINESSKSNITINSYPNPFTDFITVETYNNTGNTFATIIDLYGQTLLSKQIIGNKTKVDLGHLPVGVYYVKIQDSKGFNAIKIIKK